MFEVIRRFERRNKQVTLANGGPMVRLIALMIACGFVGCDVEDTRDRPAPPRFYALPPEPTGDGVAEEAKALHTVSGVFFAQVFGADGGAPAFPLAVMAATCPHRLVDGPEGRFAVLIEPETGTKATWSEKQLVLHRPVRWDGFEARVEQRGGYAGQGVRAMPTVGIVYSMKGDLREALAGFADDPCAKLPAGRETR